MDEDLIIEVEPEEGEEQEPTPIGPPEDGTNETPVMVEADGEEDPVAPEEEVALHTRQGSVLLLDEADAEDLPEDLYDGDIAPDDEDWDALEEDEPDSQGFSPMGFGIMSTPEDDGTDDEEELLALTPEDFATEDLGPVALTPGVKHYEIQARVAASQAWETIALQEPGEDMLEVSDLPVGETWEFRLRAVFANGEVSDWSAPSPVIFPADMIAPGVPSAPVAEGNTAGISIYWDGLTADGKNMPADFARVIIWHSPSGDPGTFTRYGSMAGAGTAILTGDYSPEERRWFALTAMDTSGNESGMSEYANAARTSLVDVAEIEEALSRLEATDQEIQEASEEAGNILAELHTKVENMEDWDVSALEGRLDQAEQELAEKASSTELVDLNNTLSQTFSQGINTAKQEAATDAQNKANAAKTAAENAAKAHADLVASGAEASAIAAAAADATAKANAAKTAAENAAKTYADAQRVAAVTQAAQNAQVEYDRLQAAANQALDAAVTGGGNLYPDPSFELEGLGLNPSNRWSIVEDSRARHGSHVLRIETDGSGAIGFMTNHATWSPGNRLYAEAWIMRTSEDQTGGVRIRARRITSNTSDTGLWANVTNLVDVSTLPVGEWTKITGQYQSTEENLVGLRAHMHVEGTGPVNGLLVDSFKMVDITAANEALQAAQAAQSRADAAHSLAGTAEANAQLAMTAAGTKSRVHYSTTAATGTAEASDVWRRVDSNGNVMAEWYWSASQGGWRSSQLRNEMISNLDVGKLTAGSADIGVAVANKLFANIFAANKITAGQIDVIPSVEDFTPDPGQFGDLYNLTRASIVTNTSGYSTMAIALNNTETGDSQVRGPMRPVRGGQTIFMGAQIGWSGGAPTGGTVELRMEWFDSPTGTRISYSTAASTTSSTWIEGTVTVPNEASYARAYIYAYSYADTPGVRRIRRLEVYPQVGATSIGPDSVKSSHIVASQELSAKVAEFIKVNATDLVVSGTGQINEAVLNKLWTDGLAARTAVLGSATVASRNLIADPNFTTLDQIPSMWSAPNAVVRNLTNVGPYLDAPNDGALMNVYYGTLSSPISTNPNETYKLTWRKRRQYTAALETGEYNVNVSYVDYNGAHVSWHGRTHFTDKLNGQDCELEFTVPNDTTIVGMRLYWRISTTNAGYHGMHSPRLISMTDGNMIVEKTIKTRSLESTEEILAEALTARKIKATEITGGSFAGNTFSGGSFEGAVFTGSLMQTTASASRGVKIDSSGLRAFNNSGALKTSINPTTGNADFTDATITSGTVRTGSGTSRVEMSGNSINAFTGGRNAYRLSTTGIQVWDPSGDRTFNVNSNGGVELWGTVSAGSNSGGRVTLSPGIAYGRPGVQMDTGLTRGMQPRMQSFSGNEGNYGPGAVVLGGTEETSSGSGRSELVLYDRGERLKLVYQWGSLNQYGFEMLGESLSLKGILSRESERDQLLYSYGFSDFATGNYTTSLTYAEPIVRGLTRVYASTQIAGTHGSNGGAAAVSMYSYSSSGASFAVRDAGLTGNNNTRVNVLRVRV